MDWMTGVHFLGRKDDGIFSLCCVQNGSVAHPATCPVGTKVSFPGGKVARA